MHPLRPLVRIPAQPFLEFRRLRAQAIDCIFALSSIGKLQTPSARNDLAAIEHGDSMPAMGALQPQALAPEMRRRARELDNLVYILPLILARLARSALPILNVQPVVNQRNTCLAVRLAAARPTDSRHYARFKRRPLIPYPLGTNESGVLDLFPVPCTDSAASESAHIFPNR